MRKLWGCPTVSTTPTARASPSQNGRQQRPFGDRGWPEPSVDAVIIEGCNDAQFTVIRPEMAADLLDTLYLGLDGLGPPWFGLQRDVRRSHHGRPVKQKASSPWREVDDGVKVWRPWKSPTNTSTAAEKPSPLLRKVVILDPIPCGSGAGPRSPCAKTSTETRSLGYDNITGYGPFRYVWDNNEWNNAWADPADWTRVVRFALHHDRRRGHVVAHPQH